MNESENVIAQQRPRLTHFLSIPINDENIVEKFMDFKVRLKADMTNEFVEFIPNKCFF